MSIKALCSIHNLEIHEIREVSGSAFGTKRVLVKARDVVCRVIPQGSSKSSPLGNNMGFAVTHVIRFYFDPRIDEKHWLKWIKPNGEVVTMRPVGLPIDAHGLGRMWRLNADATTWQTENLEVEVG